MLSAHLYTYRSLYGLVSDDQIELYLKPEKTADISRRHLLLPREMMSEERAQKFHTDDV